MVKIYILFIILFSSGCGHTYKQVTWLKHSEVVKLNDIVAPVHSSYSGYHVITSSILNLEKEDGRVIQWTGAFHFVKIVMKNGISMEIGFPIKASIIDTDLLIAGGNTAKRQIPLDEIDKIGIGRVVEGHRPDSELPEKERKARNKKSIIVASSVTAASLLLLLILIL
ncbi:hypothetical protein KKF34_01670 [Myxococcota bacterium]|nr:hypothetical protein [Myxococcota bacterium]MBU1382065.1 hypothetical protein [Myxococcota bacterium]MBU1495567.1 hypothetical protein [Myxococcota bacterium]